MLWLCIEESQCFTHTHVHIRTDIQAQTQTQTQTQTHPVTLSLHSQQPSLSAHVTNERQEGGFREESGRSAVPPPAPRTAQQSVARGGAAVDSRIMRGTRIG